MRFRLESDLRGPVVSWLRSQGFVVREQVPLLGRRVDLIGVREGRVAAVENKLRDWSAAVRQAIAYQIAADWSWVAMPLAQAARAYRHRVRFDNEGVGLLAVDDVDRVRVVIPAATSARLLQFSQAAVLRRAAVPPFSSDTFSNEETDLEAF